MNELRLNCWKLCGAFGGVFKSNRSDRIPQLTFHLKSSSTLSHKFMPVPKENKPTKTLL